MSAGVYRFAQTFFSEAELSPLPTSLAIFGTASVPRIALRDYLEHLEYSLCLDVGHWHMAISLIYRLTQTYSVECLPSSIAHRLLLTSVVVAYKYIEDSPLSYASINTFSGVASSELYAMESTLLPLLNWHLSTIPALVKYFTDEQSSTEEYSGDSESSEEEREDLPPLEFCSELAFFF